jgi:hypothetical protein
VLGAWLGSIARAEGPVPSVRAHAVRRTGAISIDGRLDEPGWDVAPKQGGFVQRFPADGAAPSLQTRFAVLYDDEAVFVGVWADDPTPGLIRALLTRRDVDSPADAVIVELDSYHDRRTAYAFQLNAAGVQRDLLMYDDANQDSSWDAVWTGDVAITADGWTAEYRIPLSQLRFANRDLQEWGFQLVRSIGRTGEQDSWSPWPRSAPQVVSKFGIVDGIEHLKAAPRLELAPYVSGGLQRMPVDDGDPINKPYGLRRDVGLDVKYGLGPAFTISATINPDFGQVEADPSKVNLSASELFFAEKRPFFLEGADLFQLPIRNSGNEGMFYSRRIGAAPAEPDTYDYIKAPSSTTIYGAAKLTGKTTSGWSVGVLDAVTAKDTAEVVIGDVKTQPVLAPVTNYAIAGVKRDLGDGDTSIGVSATAVNRKLDGTGLAATLHDQAYTSALRLQHRWWDNAWTANVSVLGSWVHGTPEAIAETQQSSVHYFQRPDAEDVHVDPTRTSLAGAGAKWLIGPMGDTKHWRFGLGGDSRTPGLELNDAGYQVSSDRSVTFLQLQYHEDAPSDHLLNWNMSTDVFVIHNFEPRIIDSGWEYSAYMQFLSYWSLSLGGSLEAARWNVSALRGGAALRGDVSWFNYANLQTDTRKPVWFYLNSNGGRSFGSGELEGGLELGATIQARSNLDIFIASSIYARNDPMQYIDQEPDGDGVTHFIFGRIHETDASMTMRVNWTFSPHLSLQAYAQPYISSGRYRELKDVDNPRARAYADRFHLIGRDEAQLADGTYRVMRDGAAFSFDQPDFNFRQLRSTVVLRWEYRPGSTVFAIWSHGRTSDTLDDGRFRIGRDLTDLATAASENLVMVKANYWIGL